jgi:phospholipid-binding lipoprotein MlaA
VGPAPARRFATRADTTFARAIRNPALAANRRRRADLDYAATLEAWLIASIARDPASLEVAVGQAVAAYPAGREALAQAAGRAYPGYATRITAAAGSGLSPDTRAVPVTGWTAVTVPDEAESEPPPRQAVGVEEVWDPLEPLNRTIHSVNDVIDTVIVRPLAWTYNTLAPDLVIEAVRKFFDNLRAPVIFANDLLQLSFGDAAVTFGRFGVNSTVGVLGFFDPATAFGLEAHNADFGQTLHSYGTGPGPYIVLPLVGPSTVRDGIGMVVDIFFQPLTYFLTGEQALAVRGVNGIVTREELLEPLDELRASSVDYYSALQSAYYQRRAIELSKGLPGAVVKGQDADRLFDEAE